MGSFTVIHQSINTANTSFPSPFHIRVSGFSKLKEGRRRRRQVRVSLPLRSISSWNQQTSLPYHLTFPERRKYVLPLFEPESPVLSATYYHRHQNRTSIIRKRRTKASPYLPTCHRTTITSIARPNSRIIHPKPCKRDRQSSNAATPGRQHKFGRRMGGRMGCVCSAAGEERSG